MLGGMCEMSNISGNKNYYTVHYLPTPWKGVGGGIGIIECGNRSGMQRAWGRAATYLCCLFNWGVRLCSSTRGTNYSQVHGIYLECRYSMVCLSGSFDRVIIGY